MAKSDGDVSVCFPGEERWELWRLKSGRFELADTAAPAAEGGEPEPFKAATHYAFPVHSVYAVPIWTGTDDPSLLGDLVEMQLEKAGLKPEAGPGVMLEYRSVGAGDSVPGRDPEAAPRNLVLATVMNASYPHPLPRQGGKGFDVSPRFLVLPGNHLTIWKELGRLVMALTRGGQLVYFQGLSSGELDAATVHEIRCVLLGLEGQGIVAAPSGVHVWLDEIDDAAGAMLQEAVGCDALVGLRPDPVLPGEASALLPPEIAVQRARKRRAAKVRNVFLALAGCYLAFLAYYFYSYFKVVTEEKQLAARAAELRPQASWMPPFRKRWAEFENVINSDRYPSELLHLCTNVLPPKDVRFVNFSVQEGNITIIGECRDANAGRKFGAKLFQNSLLSDYDWIWLQRPTADPRRKDGTATFRIQGNYKFKNA